MYRGIQFDRKHEAARKVVRLESRERKIEREKGEEGGERERKGGGER